MKNNRVSSILLIVFAPLVLGVDLLSKFLVQANLPLKSRSPFLPGFLSFYFDVNDGGPWSIMSGQTVLFCVVTVLFLLVFLWYFFSKRKKSALFGAAAGLLVGGALGNLFDRIVYGHVRDFLSFDFFAFPTFNIADMCICVGVVLLAIYLIFLYPKECESDKKYMLECGFEPEFKGDVSTDDLDSPVTEKFSIKRMMSVKEIIQKRKSNKKKNKGESNE